MNKKIFALSLMVLCMTSCKDYSQKDWHIKTVELADEYFPKYFEAIEESLSKNGIEYEKESKEVKYDELKDKIYRLNYYVSEQIFYDVEYIWDGDSDHTSSIIDCGFNFYSSNMDEILNMPQKYINVMIDIVKFCSHNFMETGEKFNAYFSEIQKKYLLGKIDDKLSEYSIIRIGEIYDESLPPRRGINLKISNEINCAVIYFKDYLTDIHIWDK